MKKFLFVCVVMSSGFWFTGCKNNDDPKTVLIAFFNAVGNKDIETAKKLSTADTKKWLDKMAQIFELSKNSGVEEPNSFDVNAFDFGDVKIGGDSAIVLTKEKKTGRINNLKLKKEGGEWKVAIDFAAMDEEAINTESTRILDSLKVSPDNMKSLNIDSFIEAQKKGMKSIDSMLKKIESH
ncbi:hypothetical protein ACQ33O_07615 [Ferruginibacter sp. SUN002]|uniref:hypothetical protein n=1 Tax=Ferruginibacter sp. SUN002 TaxID=2937789 RepID=UPI003D35A407